MKFIFFIVACILSFSLGYAQTNTISIQEETDHIIDRLSIMGPNYSFNTAVKPYNRREVVEMTQDFDSLNLIKKFQIQVRMLENMNQEYTHKSIEKKHTFYNNKSEFLGIHEKDFDFVVNPVIGYQQMFSQNGEKGLFYNKRGFSIRANLMKKIFLQTEWTDNQERGPFQFKDYTKKYNAAQGIGYFLPFKTTGVDYLDVNSRLNVAIIKNKMDFTFGYDRNFLGNGYRSLFLSDNSNANLFLKLNTKIWKLNYSNYVMELMPYRAPVFDHLLPRKYAAINYLSINLNKNISLGLFEGVILRRQTHFDYMYFAPIIFLRAAERNIGSPDNALLGGDIKINLANTMQLYSQVIFDEFQFNELKQGTGAWSNKFGIQAGLKYINAFTVKNLDLQGEINILRPFTFSYHSVGDTILNSSLPVVYSNYAHYGQPLAHPLGSGFREFIGIVNYQVTKNIFFKVRGLYTTLGVDSGGINFGNNIQSDNRFRNAERGIKLINGISSNILFAEFMISYAILPNVYLDGTATIRKQNYQALFASVNDTYFSIGFRMNSKFRRYDY